MQSFNDFLESRAINKEKLAKAIGVTAVTVRQHAKGKEISKEVAKKYAKFFGIDYKEFMIRFVL